MGTNCYRKGYESGPWYELKAIRNVIDSKEAKGAPATEERELYESWLKFPEYLSADKVNMAKGFYATLSVVRKPQESVSIIAEGILSTPPNYETTDKPLLAPTTLLQAPGRGRPRTSGGELSRTTEWRRKKELQGMLV